MNRVRLRACSLRGLCRIALCLGLLALTCNAQRRASNRVPVAATGTVKAIWEPMNYPEDIQLADVYFANDRVGWISGKGPGGFILHTADGGQNWDVQMGDPHSDNPEVTKLHFLDASHGWAVQNGQLVRTTNGKTWETIGPFAPNNPMEQYRFLSVQDGFEVGGYYNGSTIFATHDGGRNWKPVYQCATTIQVNGLNRNSSCFLRDLQFPSLKVGYAVGGGFNDPWAVIAKTVDGGATWKVIFASTDVQSAFGVFFADENHGVVTLRDKRVLITTDGGQSWRGATGSAEAALEFADPQVGWSCAMRTNPGCSYTLDGGNSWTSRNISFPAQISGYSVPRRDRMYVVGEHGMIYRYRVVPRDYTARNILDAPVMPGYGEPIVTQLEQMETQVAALQTQLGGTGTPDSPTAGAPAPTPAGGGTGFAQDTGTPPVAANPVADGGPNQDVATAGGAPPDPAAAVGGFVQDATTAPNSPFVQNCCAPQVDALQSSFTSIAQEVPTFSSRYRNLNLLFIGINMLGDMMGRTRQIKESFVALKKAPDGQTAAAALASLSGNLQGASQAIATQFQNLGAAPPTAGLGGVIGNQLVTSPSAPGGFQQDTGAAAPAAPLAPNSSGPAAQPGNQPGNKGSQGGDAAGKAVDKLKKKIPKLPF
ncbi:MAG: hypothetical protein LAP40_25135 [Acidobacteriia bacterium]|nr:hypothetical protein [Terriglobia bacterium]